MTYKCKICGGQTTVDTQNGIAICEYCGTKQALPLFTDDSKRMLYERGNNYLSHSEYDKAENVFNQLLTIRPNAAELYWDLVLCKYGVTYVKDPKTGKYIPTCNRTHYTPIFSDENYKKAIELSSGEKKALFEDDAKTIDNIQKGIIAVSKKEKPFDVFISYKETDTNGNRTKDSIEAQKLYEKLTEAGYKVFFSRITLEDKVGTEYEPYIYAALYSSKVMLTICSSKENIDAVWVKNEWARFLGFRQNDNSKTLLPLYFDMDKADLPEEFALLSAYDMSADGFTDELLRGIKKLIPLPIMKAKKRKQMAKAFGISATCFGVVAIIAVSVLLNFNFKNKKYLAAQTLFDNAQYEEATKEFEALGDYKYSKEMVKKCAIQPKYDAAEKLYYDGKYAEAAWAFKALGDYEDSAKQKEKAELSWRKSLATVYFDTKNYISKNGTVSGVGALDIADNGKVTSLIGNDNVYSPYYSTVTVLYENGLVSHPDLDVKLAENTEWSNIVKISETFNSDMIALKTDGKIAILSENNMLDDLLEWENIIDFKEDYYESLAGGGGLIIGLKADGTLLATQYCDDFEVDSFNMEPIYEILNNFSNVKDFAFFSTYSSHDGYMPTPYLEIIALTNDNKLLIYKDGVFSMSDGRDISVLVSTSVVLKRNGDLVELDKNKVLLQDVIHCHSNCAIKRSGQIFTYSTYDEKAFDKGITTIVHEEWISRLD